MAPPDIKADARRVFAVIKAGGTALLPADVGYFLVGGNPASMEKIFTTKKRGAHKRHPTIGTFEQEQALHILDPQEAEIVRTLTQDFGLPLGIVAKYRPGHPLIKSMGEEQLEATSAEGTFHMALNSGAFANELARLAAGEDFVLSCSSANPTGTGNKYRVEDIPKEIVDIADIVIDHGLAKWWVHGLGSTIIEFKGSGIDVVRIGACYDVIKDLVKRFWDIELPSDPGRASVPHGNLKTLPPSETLKKLVQQAEGVA